MKEYSEQEFVKILCLVPGFGKMSNGLFDYATSLESELRKSGFNLIYDPLKVNEVDAILLNYSGYGYQKRGVPFGLYSTLRSLLKNKKVPLYTYFHEVYAGRENIFTSSFWLHSLQKKIYRMIFEMSDAAFCGNEIIFDIIRRENKASGKLHLAPLFSNIPVVDKLPMFETRANSAVVFGTPGRRQAVYMDERINECCKRLEIDSIIDVGSGFNNAWVNSISVPVITKGRLANEDVASSLRESKYGFISYPEHIFGKSSIFAAYAANGLAIINFSDEVHEPREGLKRDVHYVDAMDLVSSQQLNSAELSANVFSWYQPRSVENHVRIILDVIQR